jgi:hypothetical protein
MSRIVTLLLLCAAAFAAYRSIRLSARATDLQRAIAARQERLQGTNDLLQHRDDLRKIVEKLYFEQDAFIQRLSRQLADCQSREDFLVREGPWIVTSRLKNSLASTERIGVYLPQGRHTLKFAAEESLHKESRSESLRRALHLGDMRGFKRFVAIDLGETPEVLELQLSWTFDNDDARVQIRLLGRENAVLAEHSVPMPAKRIDADFVSKDNGFHFAYPSEVTLGEHARAHFTDGHLPHTRLITLRGSGNPSLTSTLLVWIESDAPPCIPALLAARKFQDVVRLRDRNPLSSVRAFEQLFEPYDHSGRHHFRLNGSGSLRRQYSYL